ncbi:MAG TPA: IS91 family transposase [Candidatus Xenobia bacterium]|jgi:hypothetical protein
MADVFQRNFRSYCEKFRPPLLHYQVMQRIQDCRTHVLGGHQEQCNLCGAKVNVYNSCRDRHCGKCLSMHRELWLEARRAELLPVHYFHGVFTVPDPIGALALQNKEVVYDILFKAVGKTLRTIAANPKHLGAEIGYVAILHTWGQTLLAHPHIHCIIPGGGISLDGTRWVPTRKKFFLSVRVLSRKFRHLFEVALKKAFNTGKLEFHGRLDHLRDIDQFSAWLDDVRKKEWVVYAKETYGSPEQAMAYVGRYTHKTAITNHRLVSTTDNGVTFRYKDYKRGKNNLLVTLDPHEFMRRFLLHTLPKGFVRIRYGGFLAHRHRKVKLALIRKLLSSPAPPQERTSAEPAPTIPEAATCDEVAVTTESIPLVSLIRSGDRRKQLYERLTGRPIDLCRVCNQGRMVKTIDIPPLDNRFRRRRRRRRVRALERMDSS